MNTHYSVINMEEMVTIKMPKRDMDSFLKVVEDIRFIKEAEKGDNEISSGKFKTLNSLKKKHGIQR